MTGGEVEADHVKPVGSLSGPELPVPVPETVPVPEPVPSTLKRLGLLGSKLKARGWSWLAARLIDELQKPSTRPGLWLRRCNVAIHGGLLLSLAAPIRLFIAPQRTVHLFFDLDVSPITFDFCFALANAELLRLRHGLERVQVVIVPGRNDGLRHEDDDYELSVDKANRRWRLNNLVIPLCRLMPSVAGLTICASRAQATAIRALFARRVYPVSYWPLFPIPHLPNHVMDAARNGEVVRPLTATDQARRFMAQWLSAHAGSRRIVTITLRTYGFMPARNSNLAAWAAFARHVERLGFLPVFIPDTEAAFDLTPPELANFVIFSEPAWNLDLRMALYEAAWLNMLINNGPFGLVAFSDARYLLFKILTPSVRMATAHYMNHLGYEVYRTPPFAGRFQKWVWEDDTLPVIKREFEAMRQLIEQEEPAT
ncbi:MAG: hypothetical protein WCK65_04770 [Rhodospirillaceae bacterium]